MKNKLAAPPERGRGRNSFYTHALRLVDELCVLYVRIAYIQPYM